MTDLRTSQIDATIFDHDPARGDQIAPHSARADAILGRVLAAPEPTTLVASELHVRRGWHVIVQQRRSLAAAVAIVLALAAAGAGALALGPAGRLRPPGDHVAVRTTMPHETVQAGPQKWVLVGYVGNAWRTLPTPVNEKGFSLTCPTDEACYALGGVQDPSGGSRLVVEVTMDGGATWTEAAALPSGLVSTSRLSCSDARNCALLGLDGAGVGSLIETSDAGQTWSVNPRADGHQRLLRDRRSQLLEHRRLRHRVGGPGQWIASRGLPHDRRRPSVVAKLSARRHDAGQPVL